MAKAVEEASLEAPVAVVVAVVVVIGRRDWLYTMLMTILLSSLCTRVSSSYFDIPSRQLDIFLHKRITY